LLMTWIRARKRTRHQGQRLISLCRYAHDPDIRCPDLADDSVFANWRF